VLSIFLNTSPDAQYFIQVRMVEPRDNKVRVHYVVHRQDLGHDQSIRTAAVAARAEIWNKQDGTHRALKFVLPRLSVQAAEFEATGSTGSAVGTESLCSQVRRRLQATPASDPAADRPRIVSPSTPKKSNSNDSQVKVQRSLFGSDETVDVSVSTKEREYLKDKKAMRSTEGTAVLLLHHIFLQ